MVTADYGLYIDWNGLGLYDHALSDVSAYLLRSSWKNGSANGRPEHASAGTFAATLDNSSSIFSESNTESPLYGLIRPGLGVRLTMTVSGSTITMFEGDLQSPDLVLGEAPAARANTTEISAYGILARWSESHDTESPADVDLQENITTGDAIAAILDADGFPVSRRSIDEGQTTIAKFWLRPGFSRLQSIQDLAAAELGIIREGKDGKIIFEDRARPFAGSPPVANRSNTIQSTYGTGTLNLWKLTQVNPLPGIFNRARCNVRTFNRSDETVLVVLADVINGEGGTPLVVPAGDSLTVDVDYPTPSSPAGHIAVDEWTTVQYEANAEADGTGTDLTAEVSAVKYPFGPRLQIVFANASGADAHLVLLRVNGIAIVESDPIPLKADNVPSQAKYGIRGYPYPSQWETDRGKAQAKLDHLVAVYGFPRPRFRFEVKANYNLAHLIEVQQRDCGDRIRICASVEDFGVGVDAEFLVDHIAHQVDERRVHTMTLSCTLAPAVELSAEASTYSPKTLPTYGPPDDLWVNSVPNGFQIVFGGGAWKWNRDITLGEFRAKYIAPGTTWPDSVDLRTVAEGGTLADNGTTEYAVTDLEADWSGCQYDLTSPAAGRWYFAFRLRNRLGWSVWSDGNATPSKVTDYCDTEGEGGDSPPVTGPPADWTVSVAQAPSGHAVIVTATRPQVNGDRIWGLVVQVKDASTGAWVDLASGTSPSQVKYDGGAIAHALSKNGTRLTQDQSPPSGFGSAAVGDLLLLDVRGSAWNEHHCQWATVKAIGTGYVDIQGRLRPLVDDDLRLKIVKAPWLWTTGGYLGSQPNGGVWWTSFTEISGEHGDTTSSAFSSNPIEIPAAIDLADVQARVWFDNGYSRSHDDAVSESGATGQGQCIILPAAATIETDAALAGFPAKLFVVAPAGDCTLANPANGICGQELRWRIVNATGSAMVVILGSKFRNGMAFPLAGDGASPPNYGLKIVDDDTSPAVLQLAIAAGTQAYLGAVYDAVDDAFDVQYFRYNYMKPETVAGPIGYWRMEEDGEADRVDSIAGRNLVSVNGGEHRAAGKIGYALDASDQAVYMRWQGTPKFSCPDGWTFAVWIYRSDGSRGTPAAAFNDTGTYDGPGIYADGVSNSYAYLTYDGGEGYTEIYAAPSDNAWHLWILWWDPVDQHFHLQLDDGTPEASAETVAAFETQMNEVSAYNSDNVSNSTCLIDEMLIWDRVLSADERAELWNGGAGRSL